ncbi:hypothetical protein [Priestia flexa]|uniref:hypothetical protein n=1 Tax=Priestia flexa TaxID=86664 RepID=UPI000B08F648|nr:hypothetical protein [Priestia flexa]
MNNQKTANLSILLDQYVELNNRTTQELMVYKAFAIELQAEVDSLKAEIQELEKEN